jgi:hypothetical protein
VGNLMDYCLRVIILTMELAGLCNSDSRGLTVSRGSHLRGNTHPSCTIQQVTLIHFDDRRLFIRIHNLFISFHHHNKKYGHSVHSLFLTTCSNHALTLHRPTSNSSVLLVPIRSELTAHGSRYIAAERTWTYSEHIT